MLSSVCSYSVALFIGLLSVLGATAGAHRLWAHRSYTASMSLKVLLMICQTMLGQVSTHCERPIKCCLSLLKDQIVTYCECSSVVVHLCRVSVT